MTRIALQIAGTVLLLAGCDAPLDPFVERERYFGVYGYLDSAADTQFVRVIPVRRTAGPDEPAPLDARVVSTELGTGAQVAWRDSLVRLDDGSFGHLFYARFRPAPERAYRLEVIRWDGAASRVETAVPPLGPAVVLPARILPSPADSTLLGDVIQQVRWPGVRRPPYRAEVRYRAVSQARPSPVEAVVSYREEGRLDAEGWAVDLRLLRDQVAVRLRLGGPSGDTTATITGVRMEVEVLSDGWTLPSPGQTPPQLDFPERYSNVTNGYGFWGAISRSTVSWTLDPAVLDSLGFAPLPPR